LKYAANTEVSAEKSRAEIETVLRRYGATGFMYGWDETDGEPANQVCFEDARSKGA
jgi:hypothetical protein